MAELPGWDRDRLALASPRDVAAARLIVFARKVEPIVSEDFAGKRRELAMAKMTADRRAREEANLRLEADRRLAKAQALQAEIRKSLELDEADADG